MQRRITSRAAFANTHKLPRCIDQKACLLPAGTWRGEGEVDDYAAVVVEGNVRASDFVGVFVGVLAVDESVYWLRLSSDELIDCLHAVVDVYALSLGVDGVAFVLRSTG